MGTERGCNEIGLCPRSNVASEPALWHCFVAACAKLSHGSRTEPDFVADLVCPTVADLTKSGSVP